MNAGDRLKEEKKNMIYFPPWMQSKIKIVIRESISRQPVEIDVLSSLLGNNTCNGCVYYSVS